MRQRTHRAWWGYFASPTCFPMCDNPWKTESSGENNKSTLWDRELIIKSFWIFRDDSRNVHHIRLVERTLNELAGDERKTAVEFADNLAQIKTWVQSRTCSCKPNYLRKKASLAGKTLVSILMTVLLPKLSIRPPNPFCTEFHHSKLLLLQRTVFVCEDVSWAT